MTDDTTRLRWPDGRGRFTDSDLDRAPVDVDADDLDRNPYRDTQPADTPGVDRMGRFAATGGDVVDVSDPDTVAHYQRRGWEVLDGDSDDADADTATADAADTDP